MVCGLGSVNSITPVAPPLPRWTRMVPFMVSDSLSTAVKSVRFMWAEKEWNCWAEASRRARISGKASAWARAVAPDQAPHCATNARAATDARLPSRKVMRGVPAPYGLGSAM